MSIKCQKKSNNVVLFFISVLFLSLLVVFPKSVFADIHVYEGQSIQSAIDSAQCSETIYVHEGIYNEHLQIINSNEIRLIAVDSESVILTGSDYSLPLIDVYFPPSEDRILINGFVLQGQYKSAVDVHGGVFCEITENQITGAGENAPVSQYGIRVRDNSQVYVGSNEINNHLHGSLEGGDLAAGVCVEDGASGIQMNETSLNNNSVGVLCGNIPGNSTDSQGNPVSGDPVENIDICYNTISSNDIAGLLFSNNVIQGVVGGNTIHNNRQCGIGIESFPSLGYEPDNIIIVFNSITGSEIYGIKVNASGTGYQAVFNNISDNGFMVDNNELACFQGVISVKNNYWGSPSPHEDGSINISGGQVIAGDFLLSPFSEVDVIPGIAAFIAELPITEGEETASEIAHEAHAPINDTCISLDVYAQSIFYPGDDPTVIFASYLYDPVSIDSPVPGDFYDLCVFDGLPDIDHIVLTFYVKEVPGSAEPVYWFDHSANQWILADCTVSTETGSLMVDGQEFAYNAIITCEITSLSNPDLTQLQGTPFVLVHSSSGLPSQYVLSGDVLPEIRDQDPTATCQVHAILASLESSLMPEVSSPDLSEWDLHYRVVCGDPAYSFSDNIDPEISSDIYGSSHGVNETEIVAVLARGDGSVSEQDVPFLGPLPSSYENMDVQYPLKEALYLHHRYNSLQVGDEEIKKAVYEYGPITLGYKHHPALDVEFFNQNSYYYNAADEDPDHAVCIIGWDDNYSRLNFNQAHQPQGDGAWIVRGSWGTDYGDEGYYYISYYTEPLEWGVVYIADDSPKSSWSKIYQYDPLGWTGRVGTGTTETCFGANIFTAEQTSLIGAVSTYAISDNTELDISIYRNCLAGDPTSGQKVLDDLHCSLPVGGYHVITLENPVMVEEGELFSVVIRYYTPGEFHPVPTEGPTSESDLYANVSSDVGQSFMSSTGTDWIDLYSNTDTPDSNACIKALARAPLVEVSRDLGGNIDPADDISVLYGGNQSFVISADEGYFISEILVDGDPVSIPFHALNWEHIFENVIEDHTLDVSFMELPPGPSSITAGVEWKRCLGGTGEDRGYSIEQTSDGGYVVAGYTESHDGDVSGGKGLRDAWVVKLNGAGDIEWEKSLGYSLMDEAHSICQTSDGGYAITGETQTYDAEGNPGDYDLFVMKLSSTGEQEWIETVDGIYVDGQVRYSGSDQAGWSISQASDGGYIVSGICGYYTVVLKFDGGGNRVWDRLLEVESVYYLIDGETPGECSQVIQASDGGYVVACSRFSGSTYKYYWTYVAKLNSSGLVLWNKTLPGTSDNRYENGCGYDIEETPDGCYVISTGNSAYSVGCGHIYRLNTCGDIVSWHTKNVGDFACGIEYTADGGYLVTGNYEDDLFVARLDAEGTEKWELTFGGSAHEEGRDIEQTSDGGFVVAGYSNSIDGDVTDRHGNGDWSDIWVVKFGELDGYSITSSCGENGSITPLGTEPVTEGESMTYTISSNFDYYISELLVDGTPVALPDRAVIYSYVFSDVAGDHTIHASFARGTGSEPPSVILNVGDNGNIEPSGPLNVIPGSDLSITIEADPGYCIKEILLDGNPVSFPEGQTLWEINLENITEGHDIEVTFEEIQQGPPGPSSITAGVEWKRCLGGTGEDRGYSIEQTSDGGYVVAGYTESHDGDVSGGKGLRDAWVVKLNGAGDIEWEKSLGYSLMDEAHSICQTSDGGYAITGETQTYDAEGNPGDYDLFVMKLSSTGEQEWIETVDGIYVDGQVRYSGSDQAGWSISQASDGGYIVSGICGYYTVVLKFDGGGNRVWDRLLEVESVYYLIDGETPGECSQVIQASDGGYVVACSRFSGSTYKYYWTYVAKLNSSGLVLWNKTLPGTSDNRYENGCGYDIEETPDGCYVISTGNSAYSVGCGHIYRLNTCGDIVSWHTKNVGDFACGIEYTADGGYLVTGNYEDDLFVARLDAEGTEKWELTFGGSAHEEGRDIEQTSDGGFVVAGYSNSIDGDVTDRHGNGDWSDIWVVKFGELDGYSITSSCGENGSITPLGTEPVTEGESMTYTISSNFDYYISELLVDGTPVALPDRAVIYSYVFSDVAGDHTIHASFARGTGSEPPSVILNVGDNGNIEPSGPLNVIPGSDLSITIEADPGYCIKEILLDGNPVSFPEGQTLWEINLENITEGHDIEVTFEEIQQGPPGPSSITAGVEWKRCLGGTGEDRGYSIEQTSDGGYVVAGYTESHDGDVSGGKGLRDAWVVKLNGAGDIEWEKSLGYSLMDEAHSICQTSDGGYAITGETQTYDAEGNPGDYDLFVMKLSSTGEQEWIETVDGIYVDGQVRYSGSDQAGWSISQASDGGYIVSGICGYYTVVLKFDGGGNRVWDRLLEVESVYYLIDGETPGECSQVIQASDGGYVVACSRFSGSTYKYYWTYVAKLNSSGLVLWNKTLPGTSDNRYENGCGYDIEETPDGCYVISTGNSAYSVGCGHIYRLNTCGDIVSWHTKNVGDFACGIEYTADGGYLVTGNYEDDLFVARLDAEGTEKWELTFGGSAHEEGRDIEQTSDGGFVVAGYSNSIDGDVTDRHGNGDWSDIWVVKFGELDGYSITSSCGENGSITPLGTEPVTEGESMTYTISSNFDYYISELLVDGTPVALPDRAVIYSYVFSDVAGDHTIHASFARGTGSEPPSVILNVGDNGNIEPSGPLNVIPGSDLSITIEADPGYCIKEILLDGNPVSFPEGQTLWEINLENITEGHDIEVTFEEIQQGPPGPSSITAGVEWKRCLGGTGEDRGYSIEQTSDGGYVVAGYTESHDGDVSGGKGLRDAWVVKLNGAGDIEWEKSLGYSLMDEAHSICQTSDGGYAITGETQTYDAEGNPGDYDLFVMKLSSTGEQEWIETVDGIYVDGQVRYSGSDQAGWSISQASDGGYIVSGICGYYTVVLKFDGGGNRVWDRLLEVESVYYLIDGETPGECSQVIQASDGGYVVACSRFSGSTYKYYWTYVAKLNSSGLVLWNKTLPGTSDNRYENGCGYDIEETPDGCYVISTGNSAYSVGCGHIYRLNTCGDIVSWHTKNVGDFACGIEYTADGGYLVTGNYEDDLFVARLDAEGTEKWELTFGGSAHEEGRDIEQTSDGGFVVAGYSNSIDGDVTDRHGNGDWSDIWVVKFGELDGYSITSSCGENGSITPLGTEPVTEGESMTYTISSNFDYYISELLVDGTPVALPDRAVIYSYVFSDVAGDHTIHASFAWGTGIVKTATEPQLTESGLDGLEIVPLNLGSISIPDFEGIDFVIPDWMLLGDINLYGYNTQEVSSILLEMDPETKPFNAVTFSVPTTENALINEVLCMPMEVTIDINEAKVGSSIIEAIQTEDAQTGDLAVALFKRVRVYSLVSDDQGSTIAVDLAEEADPTLLDNTLLIKYFDIRGNDTGDGYLLTVPLVIADDSNAQDPVAAIDNGSSSYFLVFDGARDGNFEGDLAFATLGSGLTDTDFDGDGDADILLRRLSDGKMLLWTMEGSEFQSYQWLTGYVGMDWKVSGVSDFDKDGDADIMLRRLSDGKMILWTMEGNEFQEYQWLTGYVGMDWKVSGVSDFDKDGDADILLRRLSDGKMLVWTMEGNEFQEYHWLTGYVGMDWKVSGVSDFDKDGDADILLRRESDGKMLLWTMEGEQFQSYQWITGQVGTGWLVGECADFDKDGDADILLRRENDGKMLIWTMEGNEFQEYEWLSGYADKSWEPQVMEEPFVTGEPLSSSGIELPGGKTLSASSSEVVEVKEDSGETVLIEPEGEEATEQIEIMGGQDTRLVDIHGDDDNTVSSGCNVGCPGICGLMLLLPLCYIWFCR